MKYTTLVKKLTLIINFNNLTYYFEGPNLALLSFIGFRGPPNIYEEIKMIMSIEKIEKDQQHS